MVQQVGREGVAQRVRRQRRMDARGARMALDEDPEHLARHRPAARGDEQRRAGLAAQDGAASLGQIALQPVPRLGTEGHEPLLGALARDAQHAFVQAHLHRRQPDQLAHAQAAGVDQLQHRAVAQAERGGHVRRPEQGLDLRFRQRLGHAQRLARGQQLQRRIGGRQVFAQGPAVEALEHAEPPVRGAGTGAGVSFADVAEQVDLGGLHQRQPAVRRQPAGEAAQVTPIGRQRQRRQSVLEPQGIEETVDQRGVGRIDAAPLKRSTG